MKSDKVRALKRQITEELKKREVAKLISFGLGGHGIDIVRLDDDMTERTGQLQYSSSSLSGYESPESFEARYAAGDYRQYVFEETPVVDKREVVAYRPGLAFTMPMHGATLESNQIERLQVGNGQFLRMLGEANRGNLWGALCHLQLSDQSFSGLDSVGTAIYLKLWLNQGARIGFFREGKIHWQDGAHLRELPPPAVQLGFDLDASDPGEKQCPS